MSNFNRTKIHPPELAKTKSMMRITNLDPFYMITHTLYIILNI